PSADGESARQAITQEFLRKLVRLYDDLVSAVIVAGSALRAPAPASHRLRPSPSNVRRGTPTEAPKRHLRRRLLQLDRDDPDRLHAGARAVARLSVAIV